MARPSMADLTCRIELSFLLAVELTKLEDALEQQISPSAIPEPNEEEVDMVMLDYVAYLLNRYHLGQRVPRLASTRVEVDVAEARHGLKPTHWTLFPDKSITKIDPHDGMEYINTVRGTIPHWRVIGARLLSPIIDFIHFENMFPMLKRIQSVLTDAEVETIDRQWLEGISKNRHMSWTNQTCNLGIQLAYDCREMPFQTLQNLVAIWTIYEEAIETLQSCRKDTYTSCSSLGQTAILPADADQEAYRRAIYDCANFAELEGLLGLHDPSSKIHPRTFTPNSEDGRGFQLQAYAIDFTEHAGTLNADDLRWWVLFTARMIDFAQALTDANVTFNAHGDLHFADLLDLISFEVDGRDYYVKNLAKLAR